MPHLQKSVSFSICGKFSKNVSNLRICVAIICLIVEFKLKHDNFLAKLKNHVTNSIYLFRWKIGKELPNLRISCRYVWQFYLPNCWVESWNLGIDPRVWTQLKNYVTYSVYLPFSAWPASLSLSLCMKQKLPKLSKIAKIAKK